MNCPTCGASMSRFRQSDGTYKYLCTRSHAAIEAENRRIGNKGTTNKGQARPKSAGNLPRKRRK